MTTLFGQSSVQLVVNGTALLDIAPGIVGGGVPNASAFTVLGVSSAEGVKLHINNYHTPIYTDTRGPQLPDQMLSNGVDGYLTLSLYQYDQQVLQQFIELRAGGLSSNNPTGYPTNVGLLMFDTYNLEQASIYTNALHIRAPRNLYDSGSPTQHDWFFPRAWIDAESVHSLSTQLLSVDIRININPDASGYLYYRSPITAFAGQSAQNILTQDIDLYSFGTTVS